MIYFPLVLIYVVSLLLPTCELLYYLLFSPYYQFFVIPSHFLCSTIFYALLLFLNPRSTIEYSMVIFQLCHYLTRFALLILVRRFYYQPLFSKNHFDITMLPLSYLLISYLSILRLLISFTIYNYLKIYLRINYVSLYSLRLLSLFFTTLNLTRV